MLRVVFIALVVFATIYAFVDCLQTDRRHVRIMPRVVWLVVVLVPVVGPAGWLLSKREGTTGGRPPQRPRRPTGPRGPDDDPEFLRKL
ncbi:MAG: PLDc N-terminal domain-containing protein [Humibacillus sp.]|nr:PLDc N-terminal domain-containing protein [Humibacillus sp.]MDN5777515.1 PLDc N-terminal domain-containing protein [Humibacillus sp.]